jgi:Na+/H+ antiporter NhaD/arsenite permease-like protein
LIIITFISGIASAFLVNDAVVLLFTPVIIKICRSSQLNPIPFLIAEIFASNIGSAMTITGNPQNMLIGIASKISYGQFILYLAPISILGLVLVVLVVRFFYPATFKQNRQIKFHAHENQYQFSSMKFSVPIFLVIIILFFFKQNLEPVHPVDRVDWRSIGPDFR